jgi:sugar lactone lactonase YvrE
VTFDPPCHRWHNADVHGGRVAIFILAVLFAPLARGASYYASKPDDANLVVLNKDRFPGLHADGVGDDTNIIQQAVNLASSHGQVLLVPQGRYLISRMIGVPPSTRLLGFGAIRPVFVLGAHTAGYDKAPPKYMIWFSGGRQRRYGNTASPGLPDANPGTFYDGLSNIDFEIGDGNPAAVAIRAHYAQHGVIAHVDFNIGSGYAGIDAVGNEAEDLHFHGGDFGIVAAGTSPSWQFTLLDSSFNGQRIAAMKTHNTGETLVRDSFENIPTAVSIDPNQAERLWMKDCRLVNISGPALIVGEEDNVRTQINVEDVVCQQAPVAVLYRPSGKQIPSGTDGAYAIQRFSYGLQVPDLGELPVISQTYRQEDLAQMPEAVASDIAPLPGMETWVNIRKFGAKGDGQADDLPAFESAIAAARVIFIASGRYRVTDTIHLKPDTILVGLNPITTQIGIDDNAPGFEGDGPYKAVIEAPSGGSNVVTGISIDTDANNPRAVGLKWMAGPASMVNDVKFLGGHGSGRDWGQIYNADHSGDSNPARHWDSDGPSLWITDGGAGTFADIWTASTFCSCGVMISNTSAPGHIYELSSEHHVRNEVILHNVFNWRIYAEQTEEEWGESQHCLPLEIQNCGNLTFANTILFRVFAMSYPFKDGARIIDSHDIYFRGVRTYGQSPYSFDDPIDDTSLGVSVRSREIGSVDISGNPVQPVGATPSPVVAPGAAPEKVSDSFIGADHAVADSKGNAYFVDFNQNKVFEYSPDTDSLSVLRHDKIMPFALAVDRADDLLIMSRLGKVFSLNLKNPRGPLVELTSGPAASRPGMMAVLPSDRWWDSGMFVQTNARREPLQFVSPDGSIYIPVPADYYTGRQHNWTSQPIDLYRGYQLGVATLGRPFYVADENEHKTWILDPTDDGRLTNPRMFAQHGEAGVVLDERGDVYIADGEIFVYDSSGKQIDLIHVPERPLSMVFCGSDRQTLLIAARSGVYGLKMAVKGQQ